MVDGEEGYGVGSGQVWIGRTVGEGVSVAVEAFGEGDLGRVEEFFPD